MAKTSEMDKLKFMQDLEVEMMSDMYNRMMLVCHDKCISKKYSEPDVSKGEAVCLDRCVAKFLEIHDRVGRKLTSLTVQVLELCVLGDIGSRIPRFLVLSKQKPEFGASFLTFWQSYIAKK